MSLLIFSGFKNFARASTANFTTVRKLGLLVPSRNSCEIIKVQKEILIPTAAKVLKEREKNERKTYKLSGVYSFKRILKGYVYDLNPDKKIGYLNGLYEKMHPVWLGKIQDLCHDADPYALIGCYRSKYGLERTHRLFKTMIFDVCCFDSMLDIQDIQSIYQDDVTKIYYEKGMSELEEILEYGFEKRIDLVQACIHSSHELSSKIGSNKRLAYLGDPLLDEQLFRHCKGRGCSYQEFEICRKNILRNKYLNLLTVQNGFDKFLLVNPNSTVSKKSYADMFEALFAAVCRDSGSAETAWNVKYKFVKQPIKETLKSSPKL